MTPRVAGMVLLGLLALASCTRRASEPRPASRLTEAQRDTALARSSLPGARAVGRALDAAGGGAGHAAGVDSLAH